MKFFNFYFPVESSLLNLEPSSMRVKPRLRRGFTLIELLLVITILSILMGFLFASLKAVRRYSREVSTRTEIANLEAAFRQFYDHYGYWPYDPDDTDITTTDGDTETILNETIIAILVGKSDNPAAQKYNPEQIPFFEIFRVNNGKAVNAWSDPNGFYKAKFDTSGDNTLILPDLDKTEIHRSVIVWTIHPDFTDTSSPKHIIGSWQQ